MFPGINPPAKFYQGGFRFFEGQKRCQDPFLNRINVQGRKMFSKFNSGLIPCTHPTAHNQLIGS